MATQNADATRNDDEVVSSDDVEAFCFFNRPDLLQKSFVGLNELRKAGLFCDVTLVAEDREIKAHRVVLASNSSYFSAMFTNNMAESEMESVKLHGVNYKALNCIICCLYGEQLRLTQNNVNEVMSASSLLQIDPVREACESYLLRKLHPTNCITVRSIADTFSCPKLLNAAESFIEKNFVEVSVSEEFHQLPLSGITELISKDDLNVRSEEQVFEAVLRWVKHEEEGRKELLPALLEQVRLSLLPPQYLSDRVLSEEIVHSNIHCRDLIDEAKDYMLMPERRKQVKSFRTSPRRCSEAAGLIYIVGGLSSTGKSLSTVEKFDTVTCKWTPVPPMTMQRSRVAVVVLDSKLYALGGFDGNVRLNDVERFDPYANRWERVCPMNVRRSALGAAVMDGKIYVVGGYDGNASLNSVECFDPAMNQWKFVASMATMRSATGVVSLNGKLYAAGGHNGMSIFCSVEAYDLTNKQWRFQAPMIVRRCRLALTALNNRIYACGGYDGTSFLSSVEVYDPCLNQWNFVSSMTQRRSRVAVVSLGCKIYAVGGYNGISNLGSAEVYNPWANNWEVATEMEMHDGGVGAAVLPRIT
ncbi:kelch-like protein 18 [Rhopilema esculentum]|uniref:kelch-like protein 18 n=1 Tax=Rhopilema esculentum TaxID=499914 RepID=UPI0031D9A359